MSRSRGFIFFAAIAIIPIILLLAFSYNSLVREEAMRVHRIYWNDIMSKAAEGTAEEAFSWFIANPDNEISRFLADPVNAVSGTEKTIDLLPHLRFPASLEGATIDSCVLSATYVENFFYPNGGESTNAALPSGFTSVSHGFLYPDLSDRFALLKVEVVACFQKARKYKLKYEVMREVKAVNILPGIFGQFTLFVKEKSPGANGDPNHLKTTTCRTPSVLGTEGFADPLTPLGNPLTLIHHPDDSNRTTAIPTANRVAPDWAGGNVDLVSRGWAFFGSSLPPGPFQAWTFNIFQGELSAASAKPERARYFGANFLISNHTVLVYHTKMPTLSALVPPVPAVNPSSPPFNGDAGHPFIGWLIYMKRIGYFSGTQAAMDDLGIGNLLRSYYQDPDHLNELEHGSLIMPMGSIYPVSASSISDSRSPSVILGPTSLRMIQAGYISQLDQTAEAAITAGTDIVGALENQADNDKPQLSVIPYFPILGNSIVSGKPDSVGWANHLIWGAVSEKGVTNPGNYTSRDWAAVNWNILTDVLGGGTTPFAAMYVGLVMCKPILMHSMIGFEQILQNNMNGVAFPSGWMPVSKTMTALPASIQPVNDSGADVSDTVDSFFHSDTGRGVNGNRLALKDTSGLRMMVGYLGAVWPFSATSVSETSPLVFSEYDFRYKTTHLIKTPSEFLSRFVRQEGQNSVLCLQGGIVTVLGGDLALSGNGGKLLYKDDGGMLIVENGDLILKSDILRGTNAVPQPPLTLATAKSGKNIVFAGASRVDAFLISSGTLKRSSLNAIKVKGGVAVRTLDFSESSSDSIFKGHPATVDERNTITWDPVFNVFKPEVRKSGIRFHLGGRRSFWKTEPG
ncbi:MAG: hypothetical protein HQM10_11430 [Candidatus Riflebacteria bacterium]|nr:hypothetical protein [Candidatus Riflebacteria bacterium]